MQTQNKSIAAVVVTYNRKSLLPQCLDAVLGQTRPVDAVYVIDNASTDGTDSLVQFQYANRVNYHRLPDNRGGAGGFHYGMAVAQAAEHEWIWIMDDDVTPAPDCLEQLLAYKDSAVVLVPLRVKKDLRTVVGAAISFNLRHPTLPFVIEAAAEKYPTVMQAPPVFRVENFAFEGPLIHRRVLDRIGLPRTDFFISGDDVEYSLRLRAAGVGECLCVRDALLIRPLDDNRPARDWQKYHMWRNYLYVRRVYAESWIMRVRPYASFTLGSIGEAIRRGSTWAELRLRRDAMADSVHSTLPSRHRPS